MPNPLTIAALVGVVATAHNNRSLRKKNQQLAQNVIFLADLNRILAHQNGYLAQMLDNNNIEVTTFDQIAMSNPDL